LKLHNNRLTSASNYRAHDLLLNDDSMILHEIHLYRVRLQELLNIYAACCSAANVKCSTLCAMCELAVFLLHCAIHKPKCF